MPFEFVAQAQNNVLNDENGNDHSSYENDAKIENKPIQFIID